MGCQPGLLTIGIQPPILNWQPGATCQVQVHLGRRTSMEPITLRLEIPEAASGWSCEPVEVAAEQQLATLTLHLPEDVSLPPRTTATVYAESSRQGLPVYAQGSFRLERR